MNEINRIHLAKTPYNIEKDAEKSLAAYEKDVRKSLSSDVADSVMTDIEFRMVELLAERNITADGVITKVDVDALKERLGKPADFSEDGAKEGNSNDEPLENRKLFRDTENAMIGGVAAGIAAYFGVDRTWVRIAFVILLFISFGTALFAYILLWVIVPPARTASEKIQMEGKSVTVDTLKEYGGKAAESIKAQSHIARRTGTVLSIIGGFITLCCAIGFLFATAIGTAISIAYFDSNNITSLPLSISLGLFILAGVMVTWLFLLFTIALFKRKFDKKMQSRIVVVFVIGLFACIGAIIAVIPAIGEIDFHNVSPTEQFDTLPEYDLNHLIDYN